MTKEILLSTEFESAYAAMKALNDFLKAVDNSINDSRANYQNLRLIGNRAYD